MKEKHSMNARILTLGSNGDRCAREHAICDGSRVIAKVYGMGYPIGAGWSPASAADARRLVAAWNATESIPLEDLETRGTAAMWTDLSRVHEEMKARIVELTRERDAARATLDALANECTPLNPGFAEVFNRITDTDPPE
jgi:hypothetical protein